VRKRQTRNENKLWLHLFLKLVNCNSFFVSLRKVCQTEDHSPLTHAISTKCGLE
jgi:hypothetical protein